ncbi:MAG: hypothetical protein D8M58_10900 [Calditrichaeota bacterium]|nr:MAG: hypothetical protein DWQ03_10275 [Calditrichota bacterium]MBL1205900.1 hypothetical protein [Calditrichota bacterium]NOG45728.1 UvrD-helicase domain-containing protein [Calditrichota bacterium]
MNLTQSQQAALALDKNISVTAGAGSGKTRILVDRFLKIATEQPNLTRHIVAITFTEKAAGEMQERIAEEVNQRLHKPNLAAPDRKNLQSIRDQLSSAHISTIHGFCMRILREFPIEAGITPDFAILDPIRQQVLLSGAIKEVFKELDQSALSDTETDWFQLFTSLSRKRVQEMLETALQKPFETGQLIKNFKDRTKAEYLDFLKQKWRAVFSQSVSGNDLQGAAMLVDEIINHDMPGIKTPEAQELQKYLRNYQKTFSSDPDSLETRSAYLVLAKNFTAKSNSNPYKTLNQLGKKESWSPAAQQLVLELSTLLSPVKKKINQLNPGLAPGETDAQWFDLFTVFIKLFKQVNEKFWVIKNEQGVLDFEDLQIFTVNLLRENEEVRQKLHQRFRYIMVDEFQDTNPIQWEIVELLSMENERLAPDQTFVVGDPKQSIYGFREADIRIFKNVVQQFSDESGSLFAETYPGNIVFRESFRFLPQINSFINHFFSQILSLDSNNPFEVGYENLSAQRDVPGKGDIELAVFDEDNQTLSEPDFMALKIQELMQQKAQVYEWSDGKEQPREIRYGDIAILIRDRSSLSDIEQAFRKHNVPFKTVGGIGFWQRQEIFDFYHILRFLANPNDDFALVALLRSRLFLLPDTALFFFTDIKEDNFLKRLAILKDDDRLSENERQKCVEAFNLITRWVAFRERLTLGELLNTIVEDTYLFARLNAEFSGEQRTANLQKIIDLADSFDQSGPGGLHAFLDTIDDLINRQVPEGEAFLALEDTGSVKIMTIHVSKGLQFPVVFTPFLNRTMRGTGNDVLIDRELGMAVSLKGDEEYGNSENENTLYNLLRIRQKQKELAELKRIFYVAVSRASDWLFMSASAKKDKSRSDSMFKWLEECLINEGKSPYLANTIHFDGFDLKIVREYEVSDQDYAHSPGFSKLIETLRNRDELPESNSKKIKIARPIEPKSLGRIFSATALMTFVRDPEEYYQRYHLGYFEGDYQKFVVDVKSSGEIDSLLKGKIVHRFLEVYKSEDEEAGLLIERILFEHEIYDPQMTNALTGELINILQKMHGSEIGQSILNARETKNEISLTMKLGLDFFTGTIDRMQKDESGNWQIIDYKTNRIGEAQLKEAGEEYKTQIESYALLLSRLYPKQTSYKVSLYFLTVDRLYEQDFSQDSVKEIESRFAEVIREIKERYPVT